MPVIAKAATVASGETPIRIAWTYNALADKDSLKGNPPIEVVVPTTGRFGGMYVQAISKYAPHPNAAKLWMEYLYSDEGQNAWLKGYCNPIRYEDMVTKGTVDAAAEAKLPGHQGRRPADPRPDHQGDRRDRQGLADHRRRDRQVTRHRLRDRRHDVGRLPRPPRARYRRALGVVDSAGPGSASSPSSLFAGLFLLIPTFYLVVGSFQDNGRPARRSRTTSTSVRRRSRNAFFSSIEISIVTAVLGGVFGFLLAYAIIGGGLPGPLRAGAPDLLRGRVELRRRPAGPRVHLHARARRAS